MCWLSVEQVRENWGEIKNRLSEDPRFQRYFSIESFVEDVSKHYVQVWTAGKDLLILTRIDTYPSGVRSLRVLWAAGSGLNHLLPTIVDVFRRFAQQNQCDDVELMGREGWSRKLRKLVSVREIQSTLVIPVGMNGWSN